MVLQLGISDRGGDQVVVADKLTVSIGERDLVHRFSSVVRRGDTVALVGPNGAGKTTLLATLLGASEPAAGSTRLGSGVTAEWFRQDLTQIPLDKSIYDCIAELRPTWNRGAIQNHLGCFGFSGDEVQRSTNVLSGGERARVALALMALSHANLLVLDEPTNHLDVESIEALEDAFLEYEGTVLLVSHDRAFLRELATRVWAFEGNRLEDYGGTFVEWEAHVAEQRAAKSRTAISEQRTGKTAQKRAAEQRREAEAGQRARKRERAELEAEVHKIETRIAEITSALHDPGLYARGADGAREAGRLDAELKTAQRDLDAALTRWSDSSS